MSEFNSTKFLLGGITGLLVLAAGTAAYLGTFQNAAPAPELRKLDELVSAEVKAADAARQASRHAGDLAEAKAEEVRRAVHTAVATTPSTPAHSAAADSHGASSAPAPTAPTPTADKPAAATLVKADLSQLPPASGSPHVRGIVALGGVRPPERVLAPIKADSNCGKLHSSDPMTRIWVGEGQGLANVFVYIKKGLEGKTFPIPATKPVVDQKGCIYDPTVVGAMAGQAVEIRNSDPVLHNVNFAKSAAGNSTFNFAQTAGAKPTEKTFPNAEVFVRLQCQVHPWMFGYVGVAAHPFFAVTDSKGVFELPAGLPAGKYTLAANHVKGGEVTTDIEVGADGSATAGLVVPLK